MSNKISKITDNKKTEVRKSVELLPILFRTDKNAKFLSATVDQLIQPPQLKRIDGWVGSKITPTLNVEKDFYIDSNLKYRQDYQLEPSLVIKNENLKIVKSTSYDDLINQLDFEGSPVSRLDRLFKPDFYSYDPKIDWDKFINFEKYYWVPNGPDSITISNQQKEITSTFNVTDSDDGSYFIFSPDGLTPLPQITLYRGVTYKFNIKSKNKFWIKTVRIDGKEAPYRVTENNGINEGTITLTLDHTAPKLLYYVSEGNVLNGGEFVIQHLEENTEIDVEKEILGKKTYTSYNGVTLSNGLKINFVGQVYPEKYRDKHFIVEGVGEAIKLVEWDSLSTPEDYTAIFDETFDNTGFDEYAFDEKNKYPQVAEYITINRSSQDRNPWSRYNRWFHEDVLKLSAEFNKVPVLLPFESRAKRPIVEFKPDIQLNNFGSFAKPNVQFIDTTTTDVFDSVEGQLGYFVDGEELGQGDRVIFTADQDNFVKDKIYVVNFVKIGEKFRINLEEAEDSTPSLGDGIIITKGTALKGSSWWFNGSNWVRAQEKTKLNQTPLFEIFDNDKNSYSDRSIYSSTFDGSKVFGYAVGTGKNDPILGFPLKYKDIANQGYYLFENYFMTDKATIILRDSTTTLNVSSGYLKRNFRPDHIEYQNVWTKTNGYDIPILQYQVITEPLTEIEITAIDNPGYQRIAVEVFVNDVKKKLTTDYTLFPDKRKYSVIFKNELTVGDKVLIKLYSTAPASQTGIYEPSLSWTNNPLNGFIESFTLTELSDHVKTMIDRHPEFNGKFPGNNNLRDLSSIDQYGTRLISNNNPLAFAGYFIANDDFNLIQAVKLVGQHYTQLKLALIDQITKLKGNYTPQEALDIALYNINVNKDVSFPYYYSDMIAYGTDVVVRQYPVTDSRNDVYSIIENFNLNSLHSRSVLVYHTNLEGKTEQLIHGLDYVFEEFDASVKILKPLLKGETITVRDYTSTDGCYVPPTPSKLGLYPKFEPRIFIDDTYSVPQKVIQGHDGSIFVAYDDYRDEIILEFERRIYNNIKSHYNPEILDLADINPGAFRNNRYSLAEFNRILSREFLKWDSFYGFNFALNNTYNDDPKTWNFRSAKVSVSNYKVSGTQRSIYQFFFDTDRPHTHPWEMLGFVSKPLWWDDTYGVAPYTKGNKILWDDLEAGYIRDPKNPQINQKYVRPGLSKIIPVNESGNLLSPNECGLAYDLNYFDLNAGWVFGDWGPVETAWRRSSHYPFAMQIAMALTNPGVYSSLLFDTSRITKNLAGQHVYGDTKDFISFDILKVFQDVVNDEFIRSSGYSVFLVEAGKQRNRNFVTKLKEELNGLSFKLSHKVGGFVTKDKLKITIDSVNPTSANPGVTLANEDYTIFLDKSSPVKNIGVSGAIVQKTERGFSIRGYDTKEPYFTCYMPIFSAADPSVTIGGKSEDFVEWTPSAGNPVSNFDTTSVTTNDGFRYYRKGQIVRYQNIYYRVKTNHNGGTSFIEEYFQPLPSLPMKGGITVRKPTKYENIVTIIPYGSEYEKIEDLYAVLLGYGKWLEEQGVVFEEYNSELGEILNWFFSAKEMIFWASQRWSTNSVITLSPFANTLTFSSDVAVVDDLTNIFYEYSVLKADGLILPVKNISVYREENTFRLSTTNTTDGIYFVRLALVQKEHTLILENQTLFKDILYDVETGYRQRRIKLTGFVTDNWNGDIFSPGFVYDEANIAPWQKFTDYKTGDVVFYAGNYYSAVRNSPGAETFSSANWSVLGSKPVAELIPNFEYKITQFEDFYSLDIDNFDVAQQQLAQHIIGYSSRPYLDNLFPNPISQYKFYQGFIKEKGTKNVISKLGKASVATQGSFIDFYEDWAFRAGSFGAFGTNQTLEINVDESNFDENPQIVKFVQEVPAEKTDFILYQTPNSIIIKPDNYDNNPFSLSNNFIEESTSLLPIAGYPRIDDVTATAYNFDSLLDIANNRAIKEGDTVWLGFKDNGDWDVLRYTQIPATITDVEVFVPGQSLLVTTDYFHGLSQGDIISISQFDAAIDGVYTVEAIVELNQFLISTTVSNLVLPFSPAIGLIFKFVSSKLENFDNLAYYEYIDKIQVGEKFWTNDDGNGKWVVYQKQENFTSDRLDTPTYDYDLSGNQQFGYSVASNDQGTHFAVSAPLFFTTASTVSLSSSTFYTGRVYLYRKDSTGTDSISLVGSIYPNVTSTRFYFTGTNQTKFGQTVKLDTESDVVAVSLPEASGVRYSTVTNSFSLVSTTSTYYPPQNLTKQGFVILTKFDFLTTELVSQNGYASPEPQSNALFGYDVHIAGETAENKIVFVTSPGQDGNKGAVHYTKFDFSTSTFIFSSSTQAYGRLPVTGLSTNDYFGKSITGDKTGKTVVVSAPGAGKVYVFTSTNLDSYLNTQIISLADDAFKYLVTSNENFAEKVLLSPDANYLFISAPLTREEATRVGKVFVLKRNSSDQYVLNQVIANPYRDNGFNFGTKMSVSPDGKTLVVASVGASHKPYSTFDTYSKRLYTNLPTDQQEYILNSESPARFSKTTFDSDTTKFYSTIENSGAVFTFNRKQDKFIFAQELYDQTVTSGQVYGSVIAANSSGVVVGGPGQSTSPAQDGVLYFFDAAGSSLHSWVELRKEEELVDLTKFTSVKTIDTDLQQVVDYLEIIDPVKGKIAGIADQELTFKSLFDPATYSVGVEGVVVDPNQNWLDDHVGELWWDLNSVKFLWYEQGELEYRKNNWNALFPGSSVDVYEWVKTPYLPTQWAAIADTNEGLALGISGQPKFANDDILSVKQVWDPISNSFSNIYYYWVKNKTTVPDGVNRKISAYDVASIIADPKGQGVKFMAPIASDAMILANMQSDLIGRNINISVDFDTINNPNNSHTEWALVQENNETNLPPQRIISKMIDSLLGRDKLGNPVPDPSLPDRIKYGIEIRPRQTMFKDRQSALRVFVEYANHVLQQFNILDLVNLKRLFDIDPIPNSLLGEYDAIVEDLIERDFTIVTRNLRQAVLSCNIVNGKIDSVIINDSGFGYGTQDLKSVISNDLTENYIGPTVTVEGNGSGALIQTEVNAVGEIVKAIVVDPGQNYTTEPLLKVRPYSVIVRSDSSVFGLWSKYEWNYETATWTRVYSQAYDTTKYWKYIDWIDPTYNPAQDILATIDSPYQLAVLSNVPEGNYVKIRNAGDGRYIIIRKISSDRPYGTYNLDYDLVYQQNGSIKISDAIWNYRESIYGWDQSAGFDQTLYDQSPDVETENIIYCILDDIFVNYLKVYKNKILFKLVKYALSEQKFLDWAFKTSFINVVNYAGSLDQRPTYKLNNESYYQSYINEAKPYRTKIRNFLVAYTATDVTKNIITDFDLPSVYDSNLRQFIPITFGKPQLNQYPWKSWADNYTYSVESIEVYDGGEGYELPPVVEIVPALGDTTGAGAKAVAYIALGKVSKIVVTDPGSGYTATPVVNLIGGGPTDLVKARTSIRMSNGKVRTNSIHMKFDRVSGYNEITDPVATDTFVADGVSNKFNLTWAPNPDKNFITVRVNGIKEISGNYSIVISKSKFRGYTKTYGTLVLDTKPSKFSTVTIEYRKDLSLYNAVDRIRDYYKPTSGMPGNTATMLMSGLEYPGVTLDTLPFELSKGFDSLPFGNSNWDDFIPETGLYEVKGPKVTAQIYDVNSVGSPNQLTFDIQDNSDIKLVKVGATGTVSTVNYTVTSSTYSTSTFGTDYSKWVITLNTGTPVSVGNSVSFINPNPTLYTLPYVPSLFQRINVYEKVLNTATNKYTILRIDGSTATNQYAFVDTFEGDGYVNTLTVNKIYNSYDTVIFRLEDSDGSAPIVDVDLDTYISGGGYYTDINGDLQLTKADDLEDIVIDGDKFVSEYNSYGPEENVPGKVTDTIGINVFTYPPSGTGLVTTKRYIRQPGQVKFDIGFVPPNVDSLEVTLDNQLLVQGVDYDIDYNTNQVVLLTNPLLEIQGPYFSPNIVLPRREGTPIASTAGDDTFTGPYSLGLTWNMFGNLYNSVYVGTNGYLTFGGGDAEYSPLILGILDNPAVYVMYCDLWQGFGVQNNNTTPLSTGETPGLFLVQGTVGDFEYFRLRFVGTHYNQRNQTPTVPTYQYEVTLYTNGTDQYVEMIFENTWTGTNFNGDQGFITGIARNKTGSTPGAGISIDDSLILPNTSHVFYSTSNGGDWKYAGEGSFDPFKNQNPSPQVMSITAVSVGGSKPLGHEKVRVNALTGFNNFDFSASYSDVNSVYVTVNGVKRTDYTLSGTYSTGNSGRLKITFESNLQVNDLLQVWFFNDKDKAFSEIKEEVFQAAAGTSTFTLAQPPGNIAPLHSQLIVEKDGKRLLPPDTLYYTVTNNQRDFALDRHYDYADGHPDRATVEVYVNGYRKPWSDKVRLIQDENIVRFYGNVIKDGDVIAISILKNHDYIAVADKLIFTDRVSTTSTSTVKVISFTNHDSSLMRKERFPGNGRGQFRLSRPVVNSNYVWVEVNGNVLTREYQYALSNDKQTVILADTFKLSSVDTVIITTVTHDLSEKLVGYRYFKDNLGRNHYKRLSNESSTQLTADLYPTDNEFTVENSMILTPPNPLLNRPGVILINGERIEFFEISGNKISRLRRGTLGTGVKSVHKEGSLVIDQGANQSIVVPNNLRVWKTSTDYLYTGTDFVEYGTSTWNLSSLTNIVVSTSTSTYHQIEVYYQGRRLRKPGTVFTITDTSIAYDSFETNSVGQTSNVDQEPEFEILPGNILKLKFDPVVNSEIKVVNNTATIVGFEFSDVHLRSSEQVRFLLDSPSFLPDKYYYGQNTDSDQYLTLESGDTLDSETGDPLIGS